MKQDEETIRERRLAGQDSASARVLQRGAQVRAVKEGGIHSRHHQISPPLHVQSICAQVELKELCDNTELGLQGFKELLAFRFCLLSVPSSCHWALKDVLSVALQFRCVGRFSSRSLITRFIHLLWGNNFKTVSDQTAGEAKVVALCCGRDE